MPMKSRVVDYTNVKEKGQYNPIALDPGQYPAEITDGVDAVSGNGNDQVVFTFKVDGHSGTYPYYCGWDENQLWKIRDLFAKSGTDIPKKAIKTNPNNLIGRRFGIELADDEYEGRTKSKIVAIVPITEVGGELVEEQDDDIDEDAPPTRGRAAKKVAPASRRRAPEPEPEEVPDVPEDLTADELAEMELDELKEYIEERGWTAPKKKRGQTEDDYAGTLEDFIIAEQELEAEEEPEPEPEPEPAPRRRAAKATAAKPATRGRRAAPADDDDDDVDDEPAPRGRRTASRPAPAKRAAKKAAPARRSARAAAEDDDDLDDIDLDAV